MTAGVIFEAAAGVVVAVTSAAETEVPSVILFSVESDLDSTEEFPGTMDISSHCP